MVISPAVVAVFATYKPGRLSLRSLRISSLHDGFLTNDFPIPIAAIILQIDGYAGYNQLTAGLQSSTPARLAYNWSHAS